MTDPDALDDKLISGRVVASEVESGAAAQCAALQEQGVQPVLAIVHAGDHADAASYRKAIAARAKRVGVQLRTLPVHEAEAAHVLPAVLETLNNDPGVHGVLVQNPLPAALRQLAGHLLAADKDVEGLTAGNLGRLALDEPAVLPTTPAAILALIAHRVPNLLGRRVVIVNRSATIGRPLAQILLSKRATVTVCSSATVDLPGEARRAEILVVAIGKARAIGPEYVGQGAVVIDVGINADPSGSGVCGDVDTEAVLPLVGAITPVPGGVGPVTSAMLVANVVLLAQRQQGRHPA